MVASRGFSVAGCYLLAMSDIYAAFQPRSHGKPRGRR